MIPKVAMVVWLDHHIDLKSVTRAEAAKLKPMRRIAVGWLWADTTDGITLAMDWSPAEPDDADPPLFLSRPLIQRVFRIPVPRAVLRMLGG